MLSSNKKRKFAYEPTNFLTEEFDQFSSSLPLVPELYSTSDESLCSLIPFNPELDPILYDNFSSLLIPFDAKFDSITEDTSASLLKDCEHGDNILHIAVRGCVTSDGVDELFTLLQSMPRADISRLARSVNHEGLLPINLLTREVFIDPPMNQLVEEKLLLFSLDYPMKKISEYIDEKEVLKNYLPNNPIHKNLKIGCMVINAIRKEIKYSTTHPDIHDYSTKDYLQFFSQCNLIWKKFFKENKIKLSKTTDYIVAKNILASNLKSMREYPGFANCDHMCYMGLYFLTEITKEVSGEVFAFNQSMNAAHWFLVIGRDAKTDPNDYQTWNKDTVICDPWSGEVFPATQIPEKLKGYGRLIENAKHRTCIVEFNPSYHSFSDEFSLPKAPPSLISTPAGKSFKLFPPSTSIVKPSNEAMRLAQPLMSLIKNSDVA